MSPASGGTSQAGRSWISPQRRPRSFSSPGAQLPSSASTDLAVDGGILADRLPGASAADFTAIAQALLPSASPP
jgi:hypothetical protein